MLALKKLGKVFKYEFIHASKTLVPLYSVLIILGLLIGLLSNPLSKYTNNIISEENSVHYEFSYNSMNATPDQQIAMQKSIIVTLLTIVYVIFATAIFIITIFILAKRFNSSMLGDEAYLNLTLPVTMGQHLWGRFLSDLVWIIICFAAFTISFGLCLIRNHSLPWFSQLFVNLNNVIRNNDMSTFMFYFQAALQYVVYSSLIILFIFAVSSISHMFQKHKTFSKIISAILLIILASKLNQGIFGLSGHNLSFADVLWINTGVNIIFCGICFGITYYIFHKQLNLE